MLFTINTLVRQSSCNTFTITVAEDKNGKTPKYFTYFLKSCNDVMVYCLQSCETLRNWHLDYRFRYVCTADVHD